MLRVTNKPFMLNVVMLNVMAPQARNRTRPWIPFPASSFDSYKKSDYMTDYITLFMAP